MPLLNPTDPNQAGQATVEQPPGNRDAPVEQEAPGEIGGEEFKVSPEAQPYVKQAEDLMYLDENNLKNLVTMFQQHGPEGFPKAMATAVNGALSKLEEKEQMPDEIVSEVGVAIFVNLMEDISQSPKDMFPIDQPMMEAAMMETFQAWKSQNPERWNEQEFQDSLQQLGGA